jgi:hypothetical protein
VVILVQAQKKDLHLVIGHAACSRFELNLALDVAILPTQLHLEIGYGLNTLFAHSLLPFARAGVYVTYSRSVLHKITLILNVHKASFWAVPFELYNMPREASNTFEQFRMLTYGVALDEKNVIEPTQLAIGVRQVALLASDIHQGVAKIMID